MTTDEDRQLVRQFENEKLYSIELKIVAVIS